MRSNLKLKKLIINADDYGCSSLFNKGILELAQKNIITSISVMIKRKFVGVAELKKYKNISVGLHLELKEKDALAEIEKQLKLFIKKFGQLPSHLDGHQHMHLTPKNLPNVIKIAKKYDLPIRSYKPEDRKTIKKAGIKTPGQFISWHPKRKEKLWQKLAGSTARVTELVCHPGYYDKNCVLSYNKQRELELLILKSNLFEKQTKKYQLTNYNLLKLRR